MEYTIKEVCQKTGLSAYALRYYEKEGLLPDIRRSRGGIRLYCEEDLDRLELICCLKNTKMPLREIARFVRLAQDGEGTLQERCAILREHRRHILDWMSDVQQYLETVNCKLEHHEQLWQKYKSENEKEQL